MSPSSISVFEEGSLVGSLSSITQLNFVGNSLTAVAEPFITGVSAGNIATITAAPPGPNGSVLFKDDDFATSTDLVFNGEVGILTVGGSSITIDGDSNKLNVGAGITIDAAKNTIEVGGSKVADGSGNASFVGVVTATAFDTSIGEIRGISTTVTSTSGVVILGLTTAYRSANYQIQATQGSNYNMTNINVIHDGTNTYMNEFGTINVPTGIATYNTDINSGKLRLIGYPASSSSTTFKVIFTALQV